MKSTKGFVWLPVLLIILGVLVVSGGAYWYVQQQASSQASIAQPTINEEVVAIDSLTFTYGPDTFMLQKQGDNYEYRAGSAGTLRVYNFYNTSAAGPLIHEGIMDGINTQSIVLWRGSGANIIEPILFAFQKKSNAWQQVAVTKLPYDGGRTSFDSITTTNGTVVLGVHTSGPDRNYHETYVSKRYVYALQNNQLLLQNSASGGSTVEWKTYTNGEFGVSFRYPSDFTVTDAQKGSTALVVFERASVGSGLSGTIIPNVFSTQGATTFVEYIAAHPILDANSGNPISLKTRTLGANIFYYTRTERFEGVLSFDYYILHGDTLYRFQSISRGVDWTNPNLDEEADPTHVALKQLLSTLTFTSNTSVSPPVPVLSSGATPVLTPSSVLPPSGYTYPPQPCVQPPLPTTAGCQGGWKVVIDYAGCAVSYTCPANQ